MPSIRHPKKRGEWVELLFMACAASLGFTVSKPWGDSARFDFIVTWRHTSNRIQVKSTQLFARGAYIAVITPYRRDRRGRYIPRPYTRADIDFFAIYVIPKDTWYIIPRAALPPSRTNLFLNPSAPGNRYFAFKEAWPLLKKPRRTLRHRTPA
jgi:hypothetical protein